MLKLLKVYGFVASLLFLCTPAFSECSRIESPASNGALELAKAHLAIGQHEAAVAQFEMPDSIRPQLVQEFSKALSADVLQCVTARRVRQSERFMGELVVFLTATGFVYISIEGLVEDETFRFANFFWTNDFSEVRDVFY